MKNNILLSKLFICSLLILFLNDLLLKSIYHNAITGKLSDFAGLIVLPLFLWSICNKHKKGIFIVSALFFIYWKSPLSSGFIEIWNQYIPYTIGRVIDYTDFIALSVLPVVYFYQPQPIVLTENKRRAFHYILLSLTFVSFIATAGTVGSIHKFQFLQSKKELSKAIIEMMESNPAMTIPDSLKKYEKIYDERLKDPLVHYLKTMDAKTADSVIFYTYEPKNKVMFSIQIIGLKKDWTNSISELGLISYMQHGKIFYNKDLDVEAKSRIMKIFEQEVIKKIDKVLQNKDTKGITHKNSLKCIY